MNKKIKKERLYNQQEYIKCLKDPYYFFRKYCVVKDKVTGKLINIKFSKKQYNEYIKYCNKKLY